MKGVLTENYLKNRNFAGFFIGSSSSLTKKTIYSTSSIAPYVINYRTADDIFNNNFIRLDTIINYV